MQVSTGKLLVLLVAVGLAFGGIGAALADDGQPDGGQPVQLVADDDARKNDADDQAAVVNHDDDDDDDDDDDGTNGTNGTGARAAAALVNGKTAAQWMGSANTYKQRWLKMKLANHRHAQQVRNLRAQQVRNQRASQRSQPRVQARYSSSPRAARGGGGGTSGGGTSGGGTSGGGDT